LRGAIPAPLAFFAPLPNISFASFSFLRRLRSVTSALSAYGTVSTRVGDPPACRSASKDGISLPLLAAMAFLPGAIVLNSMEGKRKDLLEVE
jgi:hypothetical protein